jgi:hypothetical protein
VATQVRSEDVEPSRQTLLGEPAEATAVTGDPVQADDARGARLAPLVEVKPQSSVSGS